MRQRLDCGHLEGRKTYFMRNDKDEINGHYQCERCYKKTQTALNGKDWISQMVKVSNGQN